MRLGGYSGSGAALLGSKMYHPDALSSSSLYDPTPSIPLNSRSLYDGLGSDISGSNDNYTQYMLHSSSDPGSSLAEPSPVILQSQSDFPRHWPSIPTSGKSSGSGYYMEPDAASGMGSMTQVMSSFMQPPGPRIPGNSNVDNYPNMFPALNSLSHSLPEGGSRLSLSDKVLPPLPHSRIPASVDFGVKIYSSYTDSASVASSTSQSRGSISMRRSPAANHIPLSPSMQLPSSERSTPTLSGSVSSMSNYITSSSSSMSVGMGSNVYSSNQQPLLSSSMDQIPVPPMLKQERQRTDPELMLQSIPRSSAHVPTPPLRPSSTSSSLGYQPNGDQHKGRGLNKVYS
jgi:hypothetical protein